MEDDMAEKTPPPFKITGVEEVPTTYSDVFMVASEHETGMSTIYFLQSQLPLPSGRIGTTRVPPSVGTAKCVARILFSERGFTKLLEALADNQGFILQPKNQEQP
jgi:predicted enzyme related to lactoylglutathione lyase